MSELPLSERAPGRVYSPTCGLISVGDEVSQSVFGAMRETRRTFVGSESPETGLSHDIVPIDDDVDSD